MNKYEREQLFKRIADQERKQREKFEAEARAEVERVRAEKERIKEAKRLKAEEIEREKRHELWKKTGKTYYNRMVRQEEKEMAAKKFREEQERVEDEIKRKEQGGRLAKEREKLRKEKAAVAAAKAEERRITRKLGDGFYRGEWLEEESWKDRYNPRHNHIRTPHGKGKYFAAQLHLLYEGQWFYGKKHGKGTYYWQSEEKLGESYTGEFYEDDMHGLGVLKNKSGETRTVLYHKNRYVCDYDDLIDGRQIELKLANNPSGSRWHLSTIERFDPSRKRKKHRVRLSGMFCKPKWYDLTRQHFRLAPEQPLNYTLIKPESENLETYLPSVVRTDPLGNRKQFKKFIKKGYEHLCGEPRMSGNGEYFFKWKRGEVDHPVDGRAFAHFLPARTEEDFREKAGNPYPARSNFAESTVQLMNDIEKRATALFGYSPIRRRDNPALAPLPNHAALRGKLTP